MNAPTSFPAAEAPPGPLRARARKPRYDGWLPERQRCFLGAIADGATVEAACNRVGMSESSAFAFRRTPAGAGFALGWHAADLLARDRLHRRLMHWALEGCEERVTRLDEKTVLRSKPNHRLALSMLTSLETKGHYRGPDDLTAARFIAQEFDHYLDLLDQDPELGLATAFVAEALARPYENCSRHPLRILERARDKLREQARFAEPCQTPQDAMLRPDEAAGEAGAGEPLHNTSSCKLHAEPADGQGAADEAGETPRTSPVVILRGDAIGDDVVAGEPRETLHTTPDVILRPGQSDGEALAGEADEPLHSTPSRKLHAEPADGQGAEEEAGETLHTSPAVILRPDHAPEGEGDAGARDHGLTFPALIVTAPIWLPDENAPGRDRVADLRLDDVVARDADPAIRRRAEEETWARLRQRSEVPLPATLADLRALAPDHRPLLREKPATRADPGLHALYVRRNADGELPAITATSPERNRPVCLDA